MLVISKLQSPCLTLEGAVEVKEGNLSENVVTVTVVTIFREIIWTTNLNQTGLHCLIQLQPLNCKGHFEKNVWQTNISRSLKKSC